MINVFVFIVCVTIIGVFYFLRIIELTEDEKYIFKFKFRIGDLVLYNNNKYLIKNIGYYTGYCELMPLYNNIGLLYESEIYYLNIKHCELKIPKYLKNEN